MRSAVIFASEGNAAGHGNARAPTLTHIVRDLILEIRAGTPLTRAVVVASAGAAPVAKGLDVSSAEVRAFAEAFDPPAGVTEGEDGFGMRLRNGAAAELPSMEAPYLLASPGSARALSVVVDGDPGPAVSRSVIEVVGHALPLTWAALALRTARARVRTLERRAALARRALDALPDAVVVTYPSTDTMHVNREAARLVGRTPSDDSEFVGTDERDNEAALAELVDELWHRGPGEREVTLVDPKNARRMPMLAMSRWVHDDRGSPSAMVTQLHDLSPEVRNRRLAAELEKLNDRLATRVLAATRELAERNQRLERQAADLENASRLKSEFLAMVSHELRTPINVVMGYTALLADGVLGSLGGEQREAIDRMRIAAGRLLTMINDTLDLARVEAGLVRVQESEIDLSACLREVSMPIRTEAAQKSLHYRLELSDDLPRLRSDEGRLRQVLRHLLGNAVKFTHVGEVTLTARPTSDGERVWIDVTDTGIGIPPEHLRNIFEDFTQVDQSTTRPHGGAGLGLAICHKVVAVLSGTLEVSSELGRGTTFRVTLPLHPSGSADVSGSDITRHDQPPAPALSPS